MTESNVLSALRFNEAGLMPPLQLTIKPNRS